MSLLFSVEEVRKGRKKLTAVSMWKVKGGAVQAVDKVPSAVRPRRSAPTNTPSIDQFSTGMQAQEVALGQLSLI